MAFIKNLPRFSLILLLFTYSIFGWLLSAVEVSPWTWLMGAVYVLLIASALTAPLTLMKSVFGAWLESDTRAFLSIVVGALISVIILNWFEVFMRILVLIAASTLARLDMQTAGYKEWPAFWVLAIVSIAGFGLGIVLHQLVNFYHLANYLPQIFFSSSQVSGG
ncbi:MAG: hypothetical protein KME06_07780 [Kastovskya adunca ATA6-11-RM4]|jgi:hypothetical protein|nr:hypothetical protein [Kastovskya adunca ATA6-11-RM4]